ncbi:Exodeoxyribonuclease I [gamma proteobacterium IMCC2047]|nr:Exodeoxyribonuclease I [gamma proteobacterium IMCC2047]
MSFYWYDFETFGADPFRDRPCQFAGIRTDEQFNIIGDPDVFFCKPADDVLPHPEACLITGITPQQALKEGVSEAEFIARIHEQFAEPGTCVAGYNSIRFDDEVTRNALYRNFYDPYAREWQHGNSRWDIIDMVRLTRALRPEGINWPEHEDGSPSFKLEQLTAANGISHEAAHDALSDVWATIELAKLIKTKQPKLYDYVYKHRDKRLVDQQLNVVAQKPVLHISSMFPADRGCAAIVVPLARDVVNKNAVYVYDLSVDPEPLLRLSAEQIAERIFTRREDMPEGVERVPIKAVHINKCPIVAPVNVVSAEAAERLGIDLTACRANLEHIKAAAGIAEKVQAVFSSREFETPDDPDQALYSGGFFSSHDRQLMEELRQMTPEQLSAAKLPFRDARLPDMLFRYRARNYPATLSDDERAQWQVFRRSCFDDEKIGSRLTLDSYYQRIDELMNAPQTTLEQKQILIQLQAYGVSLQESLD